MNKRLKRAFTITELVIVIAVIAVLAAVLIPTFASVVKSANKSADEQYLKNISQTLSDYTALKGNAPKDYPEMMQALSEDDLCDPSNPYLLAKKLKEDDVRMVWFPNTEKVQLVDTSRETLLWQTGATRGLGNYALLGTTFDGGEEGLVGSGCYVLCVSGDKSCEAAAKLYYEYYVTCNGNIDTFGNKADTYLKDMDDKGWANCIVAAVKNAKAGYNTNPNVEQNILDSLKGSTTAQLPVKDDKEVLSTLATLATLANDASQRDTLSHKTVTFTFESGDDKKVDMSEVTLSSIGNSYRKESNVQGGTPASTLSVNFGGMTLENVKVPKNFVSSGAEFQTGDDSGRNEGGYAFTYGLFGTIIAAPGETVTISDLTIDGVEMDFTGATETINGKTVNTFADNAGVIAGYVQGNVELKNITINGKANSKQGFIKGYDAIAGVVGRAYGAMQNGDRVKSTLTLDNVHVKDLDITGERRAAGFVGYNQQLENVEIKNKSSLENVTIKAERKDQNNSAQCWAMVFIHQGVSKTVNGKVCAPGDVKVDDVTVKNVTTEVNFKDATLSTGSLPTALQKNTYIYVESNPTGKSGVLLLVEDPKDSVFLSNITFGTTKYTGNASTKVNKGAISVNG